MSQSTKEIGYDMNKITEKVFLSLENVPTEMVEHVISQITEISNVVKKSDEEKSSLSIQMIEPERVRVKKTKEEKDISRRNYLRDDYSKRPHVQKKKQEYNSRPDVKKKRQEKAKEPQSIENKKRSRILSASTYKTFKRKYPDIYKKLYVLSIEKYEDREEAKKLLEKASPSVVPSQELDASEEISQTQEIDYDMIEKNAESSILEEDSSCSIEEDFSSNDSSVV